MISSLIRSFLSDNGKTTLKVSIMFMIEQLNKI